MSFNKQSSVTMNDDQSELGHLPLILFSPEVAGRPESLVETPEILKSSVQVRLDKGVEQACENGYPVSFRYFTRTVTGFRPEKCPSTKL